MEEIDRTEFGARKVAELSPEEAKDELRALADILEGANEAYHAQDAPIMSDARYDALKRRNHEIEARFPQFKRPDSPSAKVGAEPVETFTKIAHRVPMLSLENAFDEGDVVEFLQALNRFLKRPETAPFPEIIATPKIDGVSLSLHYEGGTLKRAVTRGNGTIGEDVTANAKTIASLPQTLSSAPDFMEIRGEVFMRHDDFQTLNRAQEKAGKKIFANPRNAAAGSLRQLDANVTRERPLVFYAHGWGALSEPLGAKVSALFERLVGFGFQTVPLVKNCTTLAEMLAHYEKLNKARPELGYDIDGVVYSVNDLALQAELGKRAATPRWAIAHKFAAERAWSVLEAIDIQVGRTGTLSPVARLRPVTVGGVVVSNATLHNEDYIRGRDNKGADIRGGRDFRVGDRVEVYRAGDVIPKLNDVDLAHRPLGAEAFAFPERCPVCGASVERDEQASAHRCSGGLSCRAQRIERLKHFVSRNAFDIEGLGSKQIAFFFTHEPLQIRAPADIFTLARRDGANSVKLASLSGFGAQSVSNLFAAIEKRRKISFERFIFALGIRHIGETVAESLAQDFQSLSAFLETIDGVRLQMQAGNMWEALSAYDGGELQKPAVRKQLLAFSAWERLVSIEGIGENMARALVMSFGDENQRRLIDDLLGEITVRDAERAVQRASNLAGKRVVFTGTLETMTRANAKAQAKALGVRIASSVSRNTDIVVAGSDAGGKEAKARELGVRVIDEAEWLRLTGN